MSNAISVCYVLADICFKLVADYDIHKKIDDFLIKSVSCNFELTIEIEKCDRKDFLLIEEDVHNKTKNCKCNNLKKETIYYDNHNNMYLLMPDAVGIIDFSEKKINWYIIDNDLFGRNFFHVFILDFLSIFFPQKNRIVFHGALIRSGNSTTAILGTSGNGKSTVSQKITQISNYEKMSDDTFILCFDENIMAYPINTGEGYEFNIAKHIVDNNSDYRMLGTTNKKTYVLNEKFDNSPVALKSLLILRRNKDALTDEFTTVSKMNNFSYLKNLLDSQCNILTPFLQKKLQLYNAVIKSVPGYYVDFNYDCDINKVLECII